MNDLFGQPIVEEPPKLTKFGKKKRDETPKGYAARPGSGPTGHHCKDCRHARARTTYKRTLWKCWLLVRRWTNSYGTDIRLKSPACEHWASKVQKDPDREFATIR